MARPTLQSLTAAFARLQRGYQAEFAGQPRHTRDPARLRRLIEKLTPLVRKVGGIKGEEARALEAKMREALRLYVEEHPKVGTAAGQREELEEVELLRRWAAVAAGRYARHFAGHPRVTRDPGLLGELRTTLEGVRERLVRLAGVAEVGELLDELGERLAHYAAEALEITEAQDGADPATRAAVLSHLASRQAAEYEAQFAGRPRISRSLTTLDRMLGTLAGIESALRSPGLAGPERESTLALLADRQPHFLAERGAIAAEQAAPPLERRLSALGTAANAVFARYGQDFSGQDRATRDLAALAQMADALWALAREMDALDRQERHPDNRHNLAIVLKNLELYEREHPEIARLQSNRPTQEAHLGGLLRVRAS